MSNIFNSVLVKKPKTSKHNLSFENKFTAKFGELTPFLVQEVLPGDKFKVGEQHLVRFAPLIHPIMQNVNVFMHYFFVPNRLIYDDWENFIAGKQDENGNDYVPPYFDTKSISRDADHYLCNGALADYMGFPTLGYDSPEMQTFMTSGTSIKFSALPFRAYQLVYNEYFRDQNVIAEVEFDKTGGEVLPKDYQSLFTIRRRAWHKDYFTSALASPDNGVDIVLPIEGDVNMEYKKGGYTWLRDSQGNLISSSQVGENLTVGADKDVNIAGQSVNVDNHANLVGKLSNNVSLPSVQNLRRAFKMQQFVERQARTGSRYIEMLLAFFGVKSSDARLQRPEYLAGIKTPVIFSEVQQTSQTNKEVGKESALGSLAGNGTSLNSGFSFSRRFEEHGFIIGVMSVMPKASYQQGLNRKLTRLNDRFDYYWPDFQHIGEQEIKNKEIYCDYKKVGDVSAEDYNEGTFGYAPRYAEYKYNPSEVHGEFRSTLDSWHMGRIFSNRPNLNRSFLEYDNANANRVLAVGQDIAAPLYVQIYNNIVAQRPMSKYGNPKL